MASVAIAEDYVKRNYSEEFIHNLAVDSYHSKNKLREILRKSPAWNEELQAVIINGNRTQEPKPTHNKNSKKN